MQLNGEIMEKNTRFKFYELAWVYIPVLLICVGAEKVVSSFDCKEYPYLGTIAAMAIFLVLYEVAFRIFILKAACHITKTKISHYVVRLFAIFFALLYFLKTSLDITVYFPVSSAFLFISTGLFLLIKSGKETNRDIHHYSKNRLN